MQQVQLRNLIKLFMKKQELHKRIYNKIYLQLRENGAVFFRHPIFMPMIIGEIRRYLRDNNSIRVSRSLRDMAYKALRAREYLVQTLDRDPSIEEISKEVGAEPAEVLIALDAIQDTVSLYEPVFRDNDDTVYIMDQIKDNKDNEDRWMENITLYEAIKQLKPRERYILDRRFFDGKTQTEVAEEIGISQAQVSRLEKSALKTVKQKLM